VNAPEPEVEQLQRGPRSGSPIDESARPSVPRTLAQTVLGLQRSVGNAAVVKLMNRPANRGRRLISRYEAGEHAQFGGSRVVTINGVALKEGELIAMGDLYETADLMLSADPSELTRLVKLIRRDVQARLGTAGVTEVSNAEWEAATAGRPRGQSYADLAEDNATHFAPGPGRNHKSEFERWHRKALEIAHQQAPGGWAVPDRAYAINGFACHFLTDAFSAGHLINKQTIIDRAIKAWAATPTTGIYFKENALTKGVAHAVLNDRTAGPKLRQHELKMIVWDEVTEQRFSEFLWQISDDKGAREGFFASFLKLIHDQLNGSINGPASDAVEVTNNRGDTWLLSGDATLGASFKTLAIGSMAVAQADQNLEQAARTTGALDFDALFKAVWDFTPRPTASGAARIERAISSMLTYGDPATIAALSKITIDNIDVVIAKLIERGYMRRKAAATPAPGAGPRAATTGSGSDGSPIYDDGVAPAPAEAAYA
jgi:hypothetical protein